MEYPNGKVCLQYADAEVMFKWGLVFLFQIKLSWHSNWLIGGLCSSPRRRLPFRHHQIYFTLCVQQHMTVFHWIRPYIIEMCLSKHDFFHIQTPMFCEFFALSLSPFLCHLFSSCHKIFRWDDARSAWLKIWLSVKGQLLVYERVRERERVRPPTHICN